MKFVVFADIGETIKDSIEKNLIPSWTSFVVQFAAMIVLLTVVIVFAYKPVKKMLKKRQDHIEETMARLKRIRHISGKICLEMIQILQIILLQPQQLLRRL